jgi:hypothetical protein
LSFLLLPFHHQDLQLSKEQIYNLTLCEIETLLQANGRTLKKIGRMPYPKNFVLHQSGNKLIFEELNYDKDKLLQQYHELYAALTGAIFN